MVKTISTPRPIVAVLSDQAGSTVVGRHRARFLHAMTTADIREAAPGSAGFALMATANGRHIGQVRYEVEAERIQLVGRTSSLRAVLDALAKHRIADDVRWSEPERQGLLAVYGAHAEALVGDLLATAIPAPPQDFIDAQWGGAGVRLTRIPEVSSELARPAVHVRLPPGLVASLRVRLLAAGAEPLDEADWERLRIEAGWPLDGVDLSAEDVALASERLAANVSWTKGCFLGQEVYVMVRDRGELPKHLRGVVVPTGVAPSAHQALYPPLGAEAAPNALGKPLGVLGTAVPLSGGAGYLGLAMLKRKFSEPGTQLSLADGRRVEVVILPRKPGSS